MTREQRIVEGLQKELPSKGDELTAVVPRAHSLPALLRRHGPVQALLFLAGKPGPDEQLAKWMITGISSALNTTEIATAARELNRTEPSIATYAEWLATRPLAAYLLRREAAVEVAGWLKLFIVARTEEAKNKTQPFGASDGAASAAEVQP